MLLHISVFLNLCAAKDFGKKLSRDVELRFLHVKYVILGAKTVFI